MARKQHKTQRHSQGKKKCLHHVKSIVVKYCEKGSRSHSYEVDEFIDLISSFDNDAEDADDTEGTKDTDKNKGNSTEGNNNNDDCVIM